MIHLWYCDVKKMWCEEIHGIKKFKLFVLSFLRFEMQSIISFLKTTMIVKVWKIKWKVWKFWAPHVVLMVKNPPANAGDTGLIPGQEDPLEKEKATHSSTLAWKIPRAEEPGGLQSMGPQELDTTEWLRTHTRLYPKCPHNFNRQILHFISGWNKKT